ncbi:hypothetical protein L2725_02285 [Shewanella corallii]|uniref:Uncharacterized protein n=2 Tax=Shewanella TaxID=22 RepID=A0ABT0N2F3_9GAMM|nr:MULTISPECIES: hypothetical protein [Shewanella]MCL1036008.1 hypothetical protein [Shewanella submarina]MCL2912624.1 hypothetical protein [Shewanella corallii]
MKTLFASAVLALFVAAPASANLQPAHYSLDNIERIEVLYENSVDYALSRDTKEWLIQELDVLSNDTYHRVKQQNLSLIKAFEVNVPVSGGLAQTSTVR